MFSITQVVKKKGQYHLTTNPVRWSRLKFNVAVFITCVFTLGAHLLVRWSSPAGPSDETKRLWWEREACHFAILAKSTRALVWKLSAQCQTSGNNFPRSKPAEITSTGFLFKYLSLLALSVGLHSIWLVLKRSHTNKAVTNLFFVPATPWIWSTQSCPLNGDLWRSMIQIFNHILDCLSQKWHYMMKHMHYWTNSSVHFFL